MSPLRHETRTVRRGPQVLSKRRLPNTIDRRRGSLPPPGRVVGPNRSRAGQRGRRPLRERLASTTTALRDSNRWRGVSSRALRCAATTRARAVARFAVARGTKASQRIYDVYAGNAGSEHYPRGWARRRAVMQKRVRRLPDVSGRTQQSAPPPNHPANVGLTRLGGSRRLGVRPGGVPVPI